LSSVDTTITIENVVVKLSKKEMNLVMRQIADEMMNSAKLWTPVHAHLSIPVKKERRTFVFR
jgi:hypothetical protein